MQSFRAWEQVTPSQLWLPCWEEVGLDLIDCVGVPGGGGWHACWEKGQCMGLCGDRRGGDGACRGLSLGEGPLTGN